MNTPSFHRFFAHCAPRLVFGLLSLLALGAGHTPLRAANDIQWNTINFPASAAAGTNLEFTAIVKNLGDTTWGADYVLELKDGAGNLLHSPGLPAIPPGGETLVTFYLNLPVSIGATHRYGFTARRQNVEYFGATQWRDITLTAPPGTVYTPPGSVWLSSYRFMEIFQPTIDTSWSPSPHYRLRAKFPDPTNGLGFHAATRFNNQGLELDALPPPGTYYPVTLYWLRVAGADGFNLQEQGPGNNQTVVITEPSVALSSYWFSARSRPTVTINQNTSKNYKLVVRLLQGGVPLSTSLNNDNRFLDHIPGPGTYLIETFWERYAPGGLTPEATGTSVTRTLTVLADGPAEIFTASGELYPQENYDESGNYTDTSTTMDLYQIYVPFPGSLRLTGGGIANDGSGHALQLFGPTWTHVSGSPSGSSTSTVIDRTYEVTPGVYTFTISALPGGGSYDVVGSLTPSLAPPTVTTASLPPATVGVAYTAQITATGWRTSYDAGGLPLGLTCNAATGQITGTPEQAGSFPVSLYAINGSVHSDGKPVTLTIAKGTPVFVGSIENAPSMVITSETLRTALRAPGNGNSGLVAPDITQATFTLPHPHTPNTTLNAIGYSYNRFSPAVVTATFLGDANYLPATLTATYSLTDTEPPSSPTNLHQVLVAATSFSLEWNPSTDNSLVKYYEISVNGGAQLLSTQAAILNGTASPPIIVVNGVAAGVTHTAKVRAVDWFNTPSSDWANAPALTVTTPIAPPSTTTGSRWRDVNGDGIADELITGNTPDVFYYDVAETSSQTVTFESWTLDFFVMVGLNLGDGLNFFASGWWIPVPDYDSTTVNTVRPYFQYLAEPGYDYSLVREVTTPGTTPPDTKVYRIHNAPWLTGVSVDGIREWIPASPWAEEAFFAFPTVLARYGLPAGGIQLDLGVLGKLKIDTGGGLRGTITLPGNITIQATSGSASATFPGGTTVSTSNGTVTVGQTVGGYVITGNSNGNITLTSPTTGATIGLGPNGGTLTTAGGVGITVAGNGDISLAVPQGSGQRLDSALDVLGKILGSGPLSANAQIQVLPTSANRVLNTGGWAGPLSVDLGNRPPGNYDVAVRSQDAARDPNLPPLPPHIWVTLKVVPPVVLILNTDKNVTATLRVAKMTEQDVLDSFNGNVFVDPDKDSDRMYVRVIDPSQRGRKPKVLLWTDSEPNSAYSDKNFNQSGANLIELDDDPQNSSALISKSILLTSDIPDDATEINSISDNAINDRSRLIALGGKVRVEYLAHKVAPSFIADAEASILVRTERAAISLQVFILRDLPLADGGTALVAEASVEADLKVAQERFAQVGLKFTWGAITTMDPPSGVDLSDGLTVQGFTPGDLGKVHAEARALVAGSPPMTICVYYVSGIINGGGGVVFGGTATGYALTDSGLDASEDAYTYKAFVAQGAARLVLAHELAHLLTDGGHVDTYEYGASRNLLTGGGVSSSIGSFGSKRINPSQEIRILANPRTKNTP